MNKHSDLMTNELLKKATHFLEQHSSFLPFGLVMLSDGSFIVYNSDNIEHDATDTNIEKLAQKLFKAVELYDSLMVGMAIDTVWSYSQNRQINSIEIRIIGSENEDVQTYFRYEILNSFVTVFEEFKNINEYFNPQKKRLIQSSDLTQVQKFTLLQAKYFLENAQEFYPFGTILSLDKKIQPIAAYTGTEYPDSTDILNLLEKKLVERLRNKKILAFAIGVDVYYKQNKLTEKVTAIEIRYSDIDEISITWYLPYSIKEKVEYGELIEQKGSFSGHNKKK